jgi:hypothetical protein
MRCRLGVGEGAVGKPQSLIDSTEHPQCEGVTNLRPGAGIPAEPFGEISMARLVVEIQSFLKMLMCVSKIAEIKAGEAGNAMCDRSLEAIRPSGRFAQETLRHFAHRCRFAAGQMPRPKTEIGGKPFRGGFHPVRQFAGAGEGGTSFRRRISLGREQRIAEAGL